MKNRFDRAAKDIFAEALARMADVMTEVETSPNPQSIDVWSTPRSTPPPELGLLGRMAAQPCLIESYSGTVRLREVRDCLRKQLEWHHELQNKEGSRWREAPALWIVSTARPGLALELGFRPADGWPPGIYRLTTPWRAFLAVRCELPRERDTLLLRATGSGRVLREAVEDRRLEPQGSAARDILTRNLARLHLELLQHVEGLTPEEKEFAMTGEEMLREVETKAWEEGARRMVRLAFENRFGPVSSAFEEALGHVCDLGELDRIMKACLAGSREEIARLLGARFH